MRNWLHFNSSPWYDVRASIKTVTINDGVTNIGQNAFSNCTNLIFVTIPNGVTSMEDGAFSGCTSLTSITIPKDYVLSSDASTMYISFFNEMTELSNQTTDDYLKSLYSKMSIHVLRLALVLSVIENDTPDAVSGKTMLCAIELCRYFIETGRKMYAPPSPTKLTNGDLYRLIHENIGIKNQNMFAFSLEVSPTAISKALSKT
jgi:hypothetical protein